MEEELLMPPARCEGQILHRQEVDAGTWVQPVVAEGPRVSAPLSLVLCFQHCVCSWQSGVFVHWVPL